MSTNHLPKISQKYLVKGLALIGLILLIAGNARIILDNILKAQGIDSRIVLDANPRLNRQRVKEAGEILESTQSSDLTAIFPSATVEQERTEASQEAVGIEIQNASGKTGAAANLKELLESEGYEVSAISTAPSIQEKTGISYKVGLEREAQKVKQILETKDWTVSLVSQAENLKTDILIVIGKD